MRSLHFIEEEVKVSVPLFPEVLFKSLFVNLQTMQLFCPSINFYKLSRSNK